MAVLSFSQIAELKQLAGKSGFLVHAHDACGAQSFTLEPDRAGASEQVYADIEQFFADHQMTVRFYDRERLNFIAR